MKPCLSGFLPIACAGALTLSSLATADAANLLAYYAFEGNYDSTGGGPAAVASQNPGELSFTAGFRGQALDINDPSNAANSGGSVDIPINANPSALSGVTFGGWVNVENFEFDGFMAIDNGGWDRGITVNAQTSNSFGIASGTGPTNVGAITTGAWQYVVGTFNKPGNATLFVGDSNPAIATTQVGIGPDNGSDPGELVIEIGRYDNQDFDGLVDDIFVFGEELGPFQVNAIRNLRLNGDLTPLEANQLFEMFDGSSSGSVGGLDWSLTSGLDATNPGEVLSSGGALTVVLDADGNGLRGVPEPSIPVLGSLAALLFVFRRRR